MNFEAGFKPLKLRESQEFINNYHRHSQPLKRHIFSIGVSLDGCKLNGVATIDRCSGSWSSRRDHYEIRRLCTDGTKNLGSFLLGKASNACFSMGAKVVITYTQLAESCSTQLADNWIIDGLSSRKNSPTKIRWKKTSPYSNKQKKVYNMGGGKTMDARQWHKDYTKYMVEELRRRYGQK